MGTRVCLIAAILATPQAFALAQDATPSPDRSKALIGRMRGIMNDVGTIRYDGESRVQMPDGARIAVSKSKVVGERIDEGGWKILVDGTFEFEPADPKSPKKGNPQNIRAAWDGRILTALQEKRKVLRKTAPKDLDVVRLEMNQADAAATVAWDLFATPPYSSLDTAQKIEFEDPEKAGDLDCDVIWVVPAAGKNPPVPYRMFVAKKDGLPRRVEIFRPAAARQAKEKRGEAGIVLSFSNMSLRNEKSGESFTVALPKGFTLAADKNLPVEPTGPAPSAPTPTTPAPTPSPAPSSSAAPAFPLLPTHNELLQPGAAAPAFKLKDFEGKERTLEEFKGKVVVLDFWGTWCMPCRMAMPTLQKIHEKYADKGVVVLGMNFESNPKADPAKFKKDKGFTYPSLAKAETIAGSFNVSSWPTFYVIGKDGKVVWGGRGLATPPGAPRGESGVTDYLESNLTQAIDKALK